MQEIPRKTNDGAPHQQATSPKTLNWNKSSFETMAPPLSAVVTAHTAGHLTGTSNFRRYAGSITTSSRIGGNSDVDVKSVMYEVGRRSATSASFFEIEKSYAFRTAQTVAVNDIVKTELLAFNKKFTNFTGVFEYMDLSALGYTLASAVAKYTVTGTLSCDEIRSGAPISIRAVHTRADPVSAAASSVFIPRNAAIDSSGGAFAALCAATNAWGATVFTDVLEVDGNNSPVIYEVSNNELALGCVYGLRILLSLYDSCGAGPIMAFAVTKGFHQSLSVVGHTDEGSYTRDVLRARAFNSPSGGIFMEGVRAYVGLPMPQLESQTSFRTLTDSILLATAGLVAIAAPLTEVEGRMYPVVYASRATKLSSAGDDVTAVAADAIDLANQIANNCGDFASAYVTGLGVLFGVSGDVDQAAQFMVASYGSVAARITSRAAAEPDVTVNQLCRHLAMTTVAPYFWIEPTSLFHDVFPNSAANLAGYGYVTPVGGKVSMPMFESLGVVEERGSFMTMGHSWRTARTNALIMHLVGDRQGGLAALVPKQFVQDKVHMPGGTGLVSTKRSAGNDVAAYLWGRGQSPLPAPAEFIYLGAKMGSMVKVHGDIDFTDMMISPTHFPNRIELESEMVNFVTSRPSEITTGGSNTYTRKVCRARTHAVTSLANARAVLASGYYAGGSDFITGDFEPHQRDVFDGDEITIGGFIRKDEATLPTANIQMKLGRKMPIRYADGMLKPKTTGPPPIKEKPRNLKMNSLEEALSKLAIHDDSPENAPPGDAGDQIAPGGDPGGHNDGMGDGNKPDTPAAQ